VKHIQNLKQRNCHPHWSAWIQYSHIQIYDMPRTIQTETKRHIEAFDYYYALGENRSYPQVADKFTVSETSVKIWSASFNWAERIKVRDIENGRKLMEKTDREVVNTKADYRKMIKERLAEIRTEKSYLTKAFGTAKKKLEDENDHSLDVASIRELTELAKAMQGMYKEEQNMVKLDLQLIGEGENQGEGITIINSIPGPKDDD